jgi:hypothetical protein
VVKLVEAAVAVQLAWSSARLSVTTTLPTTPVMNPPGAPEPSDVAVGAVIVSAPLVTENVTVVSGSLPGAAFAAAPGVVAPGVVALGVVELGVFDLCAFELCAFELGPVFVKLPVAAEAAAGASRPPTATPALRARTTDFRMLSPVCWPGACQAGC